MHHVSPAAIRTFFLRISIFAFAVALFFTPARMFGQVSVTVSPTAINLTPGVTQQFSAVVSGSPNTAVSWTVQEGASGGTIDGSGLYTAPLGNGAYHVVATSQADGTKSATATVVLPGFVTWGLNNSHAGGTATLLPDGKILYAGGGGASCQSNNAEIYDPVTDRSTNIGGMQVSRCTQTATLLPNGQVLIVGGQTNGGDTATAELYDPVAGTFTLTGSMAAVRANHAAALLPNGNVLIVGGANCTSSCTVLNSAEIYDPATGSFAPTGSLTFPRSSSAAFSLSNGTVLVAGGEDCPASGPCVEQSVAENYNPATGTFSQTGTMVGDVIEFGSVLLSDGRVLFLGGVNSATAAISAVAEIYDPSTGTFTQTGSMNIPRGYPSASLLANGTVLVVGGNSTNSYPSQAEIYDPTSGTFSFTGSVHQPRFLHFATVLSDGKVLIAGGALGAQITTTEFFDPTSGTFSSNSIFMVNDRMNQAATALSDGRFLVTGGQNQIGAGNTYSSAEIFDPSTKQFALTGAMSVPREFHSATLLANGQVLVIGGFPDLVENTVIGTAELYNPATATFTLTASPAAPRTQHTATLLANGKVLVVGGQSLNPFSPGLASAELYDPSTGTFSPTGNMTVGRYSHTATLLNDGQVLIVGGIPGINGFYSPPANAAPAEIYDPNTGVFTALFSSLLNSYGPPSGEFDSILLPSGNVLASLGFLFDPTTNLFSLVPGGGGSGPGSSYKFTNLPGGQVLVAGPAILYDPVSNVLSFLPSVPVVRTGPSANLLPNGQVLIAGGTPLFQVDLYQPEATVPAPVVNTVTPNPVTGFTPVTLTVQGANFAPGAVVMDFYQPLATTFVSDTQLTAIFPQSNLLLAGNHPMEVANNQDPRVATFTLTVVNPQMQSSVTIGGSVLFGNVNLGTNSTQAITFTNEGNATLTLDSFAISGTNSADFTILTGGTNCPLQGGTLAPQAVCDVSIQFAPPSVGLLNAELTVNYQTPTSPLILPMTGTGVGLPAATVTPASLSFGNQNLDTTSAPQLVTISSTGTAAVTLSNISATSGFQEANNCPPSLAPGSNCSVSVTFAPSLSGANGGTLAVTTNDGSSPHTVQLSGTGIGVSTSAIAPLSLTFAAQAVGTSSAAQQVIIASIGTGNLQISGIALTDTADFTETNNCPASLGSNTNCSVSVTFAPSVVGSILGSLVITANDGSPHTIPLSGTGMNFSIAPAPGSPSSATVPAGQPATFNMNLSPQGFSGTTNLSCTESTAIPNTICTVTPNQVTLTGGAPIPITVKVTTMARSSVFLPVRTPRFPFIPWPGIGAVRWAFVVAMILVLFSASRKTKRRILLAISAVFLFALFAAGCGSSGSNGTGPGGPTGTPAGTYQLVVSATSSGVTRTANLTLTVQ